MKLFIRLLALPCYICPLCIFSRAFPESKFAREIKEFRKICPFCIAYRKTKST